MPDPAKVKVAIVGSVLVIGASIGLGLGLTRNKSNSSNGAIVENQNVAVPQKNDVMYKDPSPTKAKDILDALEVDAARYGSHSGNEYIDYGNNPLDQDVMETKERSYNDDWDDEWENDGWDDDGWNDVSLSF